MNIQQMMRKAQKMQKQMQQAQAEIAKMSFTADSGGDAVTVTAMGNGRIESVVVDPEVVDRDDIETLQDLVKIACNKALDGAEQMSNDRVKSISAN